MKKLIKYRFNWSLFSAYRTELMGIAIVSIVLQHISIWLNLPLWLNRIITEPVRWVYTDGFLLLSGLGLYYSYTKTNDDFIFYKKRFLRLFIPYVLISMPFFIILMLMKHKSIFFLLGQLTTLNLWYEGNPYGMWYIGISLLLYLLFPIFYRIMFSTSTWITIKCVAIIGVVMGCVILMSKYNPDFYEMVSIAIDKVPMFIVGILIGYFSYHQKLIFLFPFIGCCLIANYICKYSGNALQIRYFETIMVMTKKFIYMPLVCLLIKFIKSNECQWFDRILGGVKWLGKYSLEIYVLHLLIYNVLKVYCHTPMLSSLIVVLSVTMAFIFAPYCSRWTMYVGCKITKIQKTTK